jgi:putative SOS response-associated peptidase YedK
VEPQELLPQLQPYAAEAMETYAVSRMVNSPQHNSPACLTPVSAAEQ